MHTLKIIERCSSKGHVSFTIDVSPMQRGFKTFDPSDPNEFDAAVGRVMRTTRLILGELPFVVEFVI